MLLLRSFCQLVLLKAAGTPTSTSVFWQLDEVDAMMPCVCLSLWDNVTGTLWGTWGVTAPRTSALTGNPGGLSPFL